MAGVEDVAGTIFLVNGIYTDLGWEPFSDYYNLAHPAASGPTYVGKGLYGPYGG